MTVVPSTSPATTGPRILLIDAMRLKEPGGSGDDWRVHLGFDLLSEGTIEKQLGKSDFELGLEALLRWPMVKTP